MPHPIIADDDPTDGSLPDRVRWPETPITEEPEIIAALADDDVYAVREDLFDPAWLAATLGVSEAALQGRDAPSGADAGREADPDGD